MFEIEKDALRKEAGGDRFLQMMANQTIELMDERRSAGTIGQEGKSLKDLKKIFDKFAGEHKKGNQAVILPDEAEEMICDYFELGRKKAPTGRVNVLDML